MAYKVDDDLIARNYLKALQNAIDTRISRRDFMKLSGAAGLGLLTLPA